MATSLVAGGAGFLGSHLTDRLLKRGDHVVVLDNLTTGRLANLADAIASGRITFIYADLAADTVTIQDILAQADVKRVDEIYHFASPASPRANQPDSWGTLAVNSIGTMSLIDIAVERNARFAFASTSEMNDEPAIYPDPQTGPGNSDPGEVWSSYNEGKRFGEAAVLAAVRSRGLDARIFRMFNCYGPRMQHGDGRLVPTLLNAALDGQPFPIHGSGFQTRSMMYVDDAIDLVLSVMTAKQPKLLPVTVGSDDERSVLDIAKTVARLGSVTFAAEFLETRENESQRRRPDLTLARAFGWAPKTSLEAGLRATLEWYKSEGRVFV